MLPSNFKFILDATPTEVAEWILGNFSYQIPAKISTAEEMQNASMLMSQVINAYSYMQSLAATLAIMTTTLKDEVPPKPSGRAKEEEMQEYLKKKSSYTALALKKRSIEAQADILGKQYNCISRMVTIKLKSDEEMRMSDIRYGAPPR